MATFEVKAKCLLIRVCNSKPPRIYLVDAWISQASFTKGGEFIFLISSFNEQALNGVCWLEFEILIKISNSSEKCY